MLSDTWAGKLAICKINTEVIHTEDFDISILLTDLFLLWEFDTKSCTITMMIVFFTLVILFFKVLK